MKTIPLLVAVSMISFQLLALGATVDHFPGGASEAVAELSGPGYQSVVNVTIPAECFVLNATLSVTNELGTYPTGPGLAINGTTLWSFNGTGYGSLGRQDRFSNGAVQVRSQFGQNGGTNASSIRLPKGAIVLNATAEVNVTGPTIFSELLISNGTAAYDYFGMGVSGAGDVNGDGYDDFLAGTAKSSGGYANIYFGGPTFDATPDVVISGPGSYNDFGNSVSGAGDVNNDGYDDVIVGAYHYAALYFGGAAMNNVADVTFIGSPNDWFGIVSGAGDVNKDGYDDVIIGAPYNDSGGVDAGRAYIYFGGQTMDNVPDINITGAAAGDGLGSSVSGAGDINKDGYADVLVGAPYNDAGGNGAGAVYIYCGGPSMDSTPDVTITGASGEALGYSVSDAGDVNGDGYPDITAGAPFNGAYGFGSGRAYVYLGGLTMDGVPDLTCTGTAPSDYMGYSVSGAGDVNRDGYADVIFGAYQNDAGGPNTGRAYVFFGAQSLDTTADLTVTGATADDWTGQSVSGVGDINGDGYADFAVGSPRNDQSGYNAGRAQVFGLLVGARGSNVTVGESGVWNKLVYFSGYNVTGDFSGALNSYLSSASQSGSDSYGNAYVDVPVTVKANTTGNVTVYNIAIEYRYNATVPDFAGALNSYISAHESEKDVGKNLTVPVNVRSQSAGKLKLGNLRIICDGTPVSVGTIPGLEMYEDTVSNNLLDLWGYFDDEFTSDSALNYTLVNATNASLVSVGISGNRHITADALTGNSNDNWTGTVEFLIVARDIHGLMAISNAVVLRVRNVNDAPVITSSPGLNATAGAVYGYQVTAIDGDGDLLSYNLSQKPDGMTFSPAGKVGWTPTGAGDFSVSVAVGDGNATVYQNFSINVTSNGPGPQNRVPNFTSAPVLAATAGVQYTYDANAVDDDGDIIAFNLSVAPAGMSINSSTGLISWTPALSGTYDVSLTVSDGKLNAYQNFSITVTGTSVNRFPRFFTVLATNATVGVQYIYEARAIDDDNDSLVYSLLNKSEGMTIDRSTGLIAWTPLASHIGNHTVIVEVLDGRGGSARLTFVLRVWETGGPPVIPVKPGCTITSPVNLTKIGKKITVTGTAVKGTAAVVNVQLRIDGHGWSRVTGTDIWSYTLDPKDLKNGPHTVEARAFDGNIYSDTVSVTLNVDHPPLPVTRDSFPYWILAVIVVGTGAGGMMWWGTRKKPEVLQVEMPQDEEDLPVISEEKEEYKH